MSDSGAGPATARTGGEISSRVRRLGRLFGPGLIWAMSAIGQTHVVVATYAGARYGYALLWVLLLAHLLAYPVFEYGARYAAATGQTLLEGYRGLPRLRWVALPLFSVLLLTIPFLILASLLSVTASIFLAAFPGLGFPGWCAVTAAGTTALVFAGHYRGLEAVCIAMSGLLLVGSVVAFAIRWPSPGSLLAGGVVPVVPAGSLVTLVALMRLPSDPASSIMLSAWAVRKRERWIAEPGGVGTAVRRSVGDFRVGYGLSVIVGVIFLSLGATVLHPRGVDLEGIDLALQLSRIYTETVGPWTFPLFIGIAGIALWGSYYAVVDGVPRMFEDLVAGLRGRPAPAERSGLRTAYMLVVVLGGLALATGLQRPVFLVILAVSTGLLAYPVIYGLNIYLVTRLAEPAHRPSRLSLTVAGLGLVYGLVGAGLLIWVRLLGGGG